MAFASATCFVKLTEGLTEIKRLLPADAQIRRLRQRRRISSLRTEPPLEANGRRYMWKTAVAMLKSTVRLAASTIVVISGLAISAGSR